MHGPVSPAEPVESRGIGWKKGDPHMSSETEPIVHDQVLVESEIEGDALAFRAVVVNVQPGSLWMGLTRPDPRLERLGRDAPLHLTFKRDNAAIVAESAFMRHLGSTRDRLFAVATPADPRLVQRRAHIRLDVQSPISITVVNHGESGSAGRHGRGTTRNISAGGVAFWSDLAMVTGDELELAIDLGPAERVAAEAVVVRVEETDERPAGARRSAPSVAAGGPLKLVAVHFLAISEVEQDKIVRRIFSVQRARRDDPKKPS